MIQLYEYQKKYLAAMPPRGIMAADTGVGKTFMALAHYAVHGGNAPLLILAPASKIRTGDWEREIDEFFDGSNMMKPRYELYSYERFSREPSNKQFLEGKRSIWRSFAPKFGGEQWAVICDEVHRAKNPQSGVGKSVFHATCGAGFFVGLSATPLPNGWIDFANYSKIWGFTKNITEFKKKFCHYVDYKGFPELKNYWHEDVLASQWQSISRKLTKAEALDLPSRQFVGVDFKRPTEYTRTILDRKTADGTILDTAPALTHALRQTLTSPKLNYLHDILEGTNENVVIFYNYITEREAILEMIAKKLPAKKVMRQDGDKHELPKKEHWSQISNSITLAHYRSGSTGVEMTYATQVIYFSPTYSYADYIQSVGRVYRNGQTQKTTFYNFRTPNSIEEDVYKCLRNKSDFQEKQWVEAIK